MYPPLLHKPYAPVPSEALNVAVWETEWSYLTAGMDVTAFIAGERTRACDWRDQFISHVGWLQKPFASWRTDRPPCQHPYSYYVPSEAERERWFPRAGLLEIGDHREWPLWMPASEFHPLAPMRVALVPIRSEAQWESAVAMREQVERAFPHTYSATVAARMVALTRARLATVRGDFFLAVVGDAVVGGVGITRHDTSAGALGRIRDVDIVPEHQGQGLGDDLLRAVFQEARRLRFDGLCLRAFEHDWPKDWYIQRGFRRVGTWTRFFHW